MKKNEIITICFTFITTTALLYGLDMINPNKTEQINDLENRIDILQEDKNFYKEKYIELANDYNDKMQELGIEEWILTDTSR